MYSAHCQELLLQERIWIVGYCSIRILGIEIKDTVNFLKMEMILPLYLDGF